MNIAVLDVCAIGTDLDWSGLNAIGTAKLYDRTSPDEIADRLKGVDICILNKVRMTADVLEKCPSLRLICIAATGFDNVDTLYCGRHGIAVCNVVGYSTDNVAQLTAAMVLNLACRLPVYTAAVNSGAYSAGNSANMLSPAYREVAGMTWGIAGYGNIGKKVGTIAKALGCRVIVYKRTPIADETCVGIDTLCRESDIISVHLPLNDGTRGLFSRERIGMMKKDCIFVNVARGAVADEKALADAVTAGKIGGIGVDVYSSEPFRADHPFYSLLGRGNVILTPHMAWGSVDARVRLLGEIILNINAFLAGGRRCRVDRV